MRILVVSDTHGELNNVKRLVEVCRAEIKPDVIVHLGDDSPDAEPLRELNVPLYVVPGVYESHYREPSTKRRLIVELEGLRFLLSHTDTRHQNDPPEERDPQEILNSGEVDVLLHGHTHIPKIELRGRKLVVNPGHLKTSDKKGYPPTYAIMDIDSDRVKIVIREFFTGRVIASLEVDKKFIRG